MIFLKSSITIIKQLILCPKYNLSNIKPILIILNFKNKHEPNLNSFLKPKINSNI